MEIFSVIECSSFLNTPTIKTQTFSELSDARKCMRNMVIECMEYYSDYIMNYEPDYKFGEPIDIHDEDDFIMHYKFDKFYLVYLGHYEAVGIEIKQTSLK